MFMGEVRKTSGRGSARFVKPVRVTARWTSNEIQIVRSAIALGYDLDRTAAELPHRSRDSVKDRYYREREPKHDTPHALIDARRQKDASEGSDALRDAMFRAAGFIVNPTPRKAS